MNHKEALAALRKLGECYHDTEELDKLEGYLNWMKDMGDQFVENLYANTAMCEEEECLTREWHIVTTGEEP